MTEKIIIWLTLVLIIDFASTETCPNNLVNSDKACNITCARLDFKEPCGEKSGPGCKCPAFVNSKNECVFECDAKEVVCQKANSTYNSCGSPCSTSCGNMYPNNMMGCVAMCYNGCSCMKGFVLNANKECILPQDCSHNEIKCPKATIFNECGNGVMKTCLNYPAKEVVKSVCIPTCSCAHDQVFDMETQACINTKFCYDSTDNDACRKLHGYPSRYRCTGDSCGCRCNDGYILDDKNICKIKPKL